MFDGLIAGQLNAYLGKYVANLDGKSLDFGLLGGDLVLTDLIIRTDALADLNLPIEVKAGHIGHLKIDIPWTSLFTADINIEIEDVYIVAGPITDRQYDKEKEKLLENAAKQKLLQTLEQPAREKDDATASSDPSFIEKLSMSFVNRLQVSVRHIHIRYEDTITNGDHAFACGIMLKQILVVSTDSHWEPKGVDTVPSLMHKIFELEEMSVYWNPYVPEQNLVKSRLSTDAWKTVLRKSIDSHSIFEEDFDFIIERVGAKARVILNTASGFNLPKVFMDFTLEEMEILLSRQQFLNVINLQESFQLMSVNQRYRKYHPAVSLKVSAKAWWKYAYTAIVEEKIRPYSWTRIKQHRQLYKTYKQTYKNGLEHPGDEAYQNLCREMENDLDVTNILIAREAAKLEFAKEAPSRAKRKKNEKGWLSSIFSWGDSDEEDDAELLVIDSSENDDWLSKLTPEEKQQLYNGIGYKETAKPDDYPPKYIAQKVQVILKSCSVSLVNYSKKILQVSVNHLLGTVETRPGAKAIRLSCNTESFSIEGASIEHELIPILTSDIGVYAPSENQVFALDFETKPAYVQADYSLSLNVQPVEIVYDEHSISEVIAFFQLPQGGVDLKAAAVDTLSTVADYSRAGLQYAIEKHTTIHVALNMRSPYVVIPEYGTLHRGGNVLIADFGTLRVESELQPGDVSLEEATMSEIESRLYDQFNVKISDVKVLLADSGDDWHTAQTQPNSQYHILPSVHMGMTFFNAVKSDFHQLPRHKLEVKVPSLAANISDNRLLLFAAFFRNFPMPTSSSMATIGEDMIDGMGPGPSLPLQLDLRDAQIEPDHEMLRSIRKSVLGRPMIDKRDGRRSITKVPTLMYTTGEESFFSASDFSDEDLEKLSDSLIIKPVDDNGSVANNINILMRVSLGELVINLSKEMDKEEKPYLMFRVDRLKVDSSITVHGYSAYATLGGVQMVDKIHTGPSGEYMEVLSTNNTNNNSNLVSIMYRMVEPSCPDFTTYYGGVENAVKIKVQSMSTLFDQASMMYLNVFVQSILSSLSGSDMKRSTSSVSIASDVNSKDRNSVLDRISLMTEQVENMPASGIKLNLAAEMNDFAIKLADSNNSIAEIKVSGFEGSAVVRPSQTVVRSRLQDLSIKDTSAGAVHPNILMLQDDTDSLFDLKFVWYNKSVTSSKDNKAKAEALDYSIRMRVGHVQASVLGNFYWEMRRFVEPFINPEISEAATQTVKETVTKQVNTIDQQNLRIKLELDFRAPTLLFPHDSKSTEMILVHLGNLRVLSSFMTNQLTADRQQQWHVINMNLNHMQIQRVTLNLVEDTSEILHTILEPLSFKSEIKMAMKPVVSDLWLDISGHLEKVKMYVLQKDIQLLLGIYLYNLTEGSPPPSPDIFESPTLQDIQVETHRVDGPSYAAPETVHITISPAPSQPEQKSLTSVLLKMEGMSLTLLTDNGKEFATKTDLCLMDMSKISVTGSFHSDGDIKLNLALYALSVEDIRPDSDLAVKRILFCTRKDDTFENFPLLSFIYKMSNDGNQKADLMVEKLRLNVHIPYMLALYNFFNGAMAALNNQSSTLNDLPSTRRSMRHGVPDAPRYTIINPNETEPPTPGAPDPVPAAKPFQLSLSGNLSEPEIVLYADPTKLDSRVAVLHSDVAFEYYIDESKQFVMAKVTDLQLVTQMQFTGHRNPKNKVILPCVLQYKMETDLKTGAVDASASISKIQIFLCTSVMQLIWDVSTMLMEPQSPGKDENSKIDSAEKDAQNLWNVSKVTSERWLSDRADGGFIHHLRPTTSPKESLHVEIKDVNLYFEIETKDLHVPILHLQTKLEARIEEWSRKMHIESELQLQMLYFNEKVSVWEPLIEQIMEKEGLYRPWEVIIKLVKAPTFPMICMYDDNDLTIPEELQTEVQQMMHRARIKSSSSETDDAESELDMTVIRHKSLRRLRHGSERSYDSSRHSSVQGESDSEPDGFISSMTSNLGSIFSSDSSDADVSETEDNDENIDLSLDKPVFLTSRGPVHMSAGSVPPGIDEVDSAPNAAEDDDEDKCLYMMLESLDPLQLNVTPQALVVMKDVISALTNTVTVELESVRTKPTLTIDNKLELQTYVTMDSGVKIDKEHVINATIYHSDTDNIIHAADYNNEIEIIDQIMKDEDDNSCNEDELRINSSLAKVGHTLISAGAFVFDDDDDYLSGSHIDQFRLKLQVDGFEQTPSILHKCACKRLIPLIPTKNGVKYSVVMDVDMWHGRKIIQFFSPLKLQNNLTLSMDVYCRSEDLKKFKATRDLASAEKFSKIAAVDAESVYHIPLFVAYHCPIYIKPSDISYELTYNPLWWPEMLQGKDRLKSFLCMSSLEDQKSFHFKAMCREGEKLKPAQTVPKSLPYYTITLHPPVILHNYLPYDINFTLQGQSKPSSLTHGEATPLYTLDTSNSYKLLITLPDYMESDWLGTLDISPDMDEFRAITMEAEADSENMSRHLNISIHADLSNSLDLRIYSPYWVVNKTDLPLQLRGSLSEAVYEFNSSHNLLLFRFKRNKRKKAKLRVYESRWSQSFSTDTVGSGGVVICNDKERGKKYMFLVQITMSKLQLTKIVTIMPFFLCINQSQYKLRYMEENEEADLWTDIDKDECHPFWPVTESFNMFVKFDGSNVSSLHFPIKSCHKTVLRMDQGRALCVEVTGGTETPTTIIFTNYEIGDAPARVDNLCEDVFIKIHQKNQSQVTLLSPNQSILYTWDEPTAERTLMWNVYGRKKPSYPAFISKDGSGEVRLRVPSLKATTGSMSVDFPEANDTDEHSSPEDESDDADAVDGLSNKSLIGKTRSDKMVIFWVSYLDGHQRVLLFTQDERVAKSLRKINEGENAEYAVFASLEGITVSVLNGFYKEMALMTISSRPALWEVEVKEKWRPLNVELSTWLEDQWRGDQLAANLHGQIEADLSKMQMMKPFMGSLRRTFHPGIWCQYRSSKCHTAINATIQTLQIDNQLPDAYFATPLCPTPLPSYIVRRMGPKPFVELGIMRRTVPANNIDTIRYAKVLIQEFNLKLDKGFILSLYDLMADLIPPEKESQSLQRDLLIVKQSIRDAAAVLQAARPEKIYFEYIHLSPLKFHISLSLSGTVTRSDPKPVQSSSSWSGDIIDFFLNSVGVTLTEIKNVELRLAYFERKGVLMTSEQLMSQVQSHFTHQALQQAYVLILGLDVLGNPYGLIKDFTQGLGDFFYEPFLGSIQGQDEFAKRLANGVQSLMGNTVGGAAGSVSMITGGLGRTLAMLTFDSSYKKKRRLRMQQEPTDLPSSLMEASKTLAIGVGLGLSGVILDPIKGAHEDGVEGFFKGIGKGLLGLLTKPTGGVLDMVSMAFDGIRRAAEMDSGLVVRKRPPRFVNPHLGLKPYSPYKAAGNRLLQNVTKGELIKSDVYYAHASLAKEEKANVILITDKHLLLVERCRFWGGWAVDWKIPINSILGVPAVLDGKMVFKVKQDDCGINLFSSGEKEIYSKESEILEWIQRQITRVIKYNEQ